MNNTSEYNEYIKSSLKDIGYLMFTAENENILIASPFSMVIHTVYSPSIIGNNVINKVVKLATTYETDYALIITNNDFAEESKMLAKSLSVIIIERSQIDKLINIINKLTKQVAPRLLEEHHISKSKPIPEKPKIEKPKEINNVSIKDDYKLFKNTVKSAYNEYKDSQHFKKSISFSKYKYKINLLFIKINKRLTKKSIAMLLQHDEAECNVYNICFSSDSLNKECSSLCKDYDINVEECYESLEELITNIASTEKDLKEDCFSKLKVPEGSWSISKLSKRYDIPVGVLKKEILKEFPLPYHKKEKDFYFIPEEIIKWELEEEYVYYKNGTFYRYIDLPSFEKYIKYLKKQKELAKKNHDKILKKRIKKELKKYIINWFALIPPSIILIIEIILYNYLFS